MVHRVGRVISMTNARFMRDDQIIGRVSDLIPWWDQWITTVNGVFLDINIVLDEDFVGLLRIVDQGSKRMLTDAHLVQLEQYYGCRFA